MDTKKEVVNVTAADMAELLRLRAAVEKRRAYVKARNMTPKALEANKLSHQRRALRLRAESAAFNHLREVGVITDEHLKMLERVVPAWAQYIITVNAEEQD